MLARSEASLAGPLVLLDASGISRLFGDAHELGQALQLAQPAAQVALAGTATASMILALAADGVTVIDTGTEAAALAPLPVDLLAALAEARLTQVGDPDQPPPRLRRSAEAIAKAEGNLQCLSTLHRWGIRTLGALAALPRADVHQRLGDLGVSWQRLAAGEDDVPLVPWMAEPVYEEMLELEWPIDGLEPLSFVLARLFEPLEARLERADRGAVVIRTSLRLTTRAVHLRTIPLPAPMRDPKTLRTLVLLDLESHPPDAAVDRVQVILDPTPGRVLQWTLFERARPEPEQVSTLIARLTALVGEGHVGSPALEDTWKPGAFRMTPFAPDPLAAIGEPAPAGARCAFRRFRLPVPVRVRVEDGRPVRVTTDRHGVTGGAIVEAAGPWRTAGNWWAGELCREPGSGIRERRSRNRECSGDPSAFANASADRRSLGGGWSGSPSAFPAPGSRLPSRSAWDHDEWDIAMVDGTIYRLSVQRDVGQWYLEGIVD